MLGYARRTPGPSQGTFILKDLPAVLDVFEADAGIYRWPRIYRCKGRLGLYADINSARVNLGGKPCLIGIFGTHRAQAIEAALRAVNSNCRIAADRAYRQLGAHRRQAGFWSDELFRLMGLDPKTDPADFKMFQHGCIDDQPL
jgi:hypothetical protein